MQTVRRYIAVLLAAALVPMTVVSIVNYVVDPFQYFRASAPPRFSNTMQRLQAPGLIRQYPFRSILAGNSLGANMRPEMFSERKLLNLALWGGTLRESVEIVNLAARIKSLDDVLWAVGGITASIDFRYPDFPHCMYSRTGAALPYCYLMNTGVLWESLAIILKSHDLSRANFVPSLRDWKTWAIKPMDLRAYVCEMRKTIDPARIPQLTEAALRAVPTSYDRAELKRFTDLVLPVVKRHPEIQFYFFFAPIYQGEFWYQGTRGALMRHKLRLKALFGLRNVIVHDFTEYTEIATDPRFFNDPHHVDFEASQRIATSFRSGRSRVISLDENDAMLEREFRAGAARMQTLLKETAC